MTQFPHHCLRWLLTIDFALNFSDIDSLVCLACNYSIWWLTLYLQFKIICTYHGLSLNQTPSIYKHFHSYSARDETFIFIQHSIYLKTNFWVLGLRTVGSISSVLFIHWNNEMFKEVRIALISHTIFWHLNQKLFEPLKDKRANVGTYFMHNFTCFGSACISQSLLNQPCTHFILYEIIMNRVECVGYAQFCFWWFFDVIFYSFFVLFLSFLRQKIRSMFCG